MPNMKTESSFLRNGKVICEMYDAFSRQAQIQITIPCYLFQVCSPSLLGFGFVDNPKIHLPVSVWLPKFADERMVPSVRLQNNPSSSVYKIVSEWVTRYVEFFSKISSLFMDPSDIIPILPLGTYIDISYRCDIDKIIPLLESLDQIKIVGVPDFQFSMAEILNGILERNPDFILIDK